MEEEKRKQTTSSEDDTAALFVTARKKQLAEQEAQRKAAEEEAKRVAAEAEVRRLEAEVAARKQKAEEEAKRLAEEAEQRRRNAEAGVFPEQPAQPGNFQKINSAEKAAPASEKKVPSAPKKAASGGGAALLKDKKKRMIIILSAVGAVILAIVITLIAVFSKAWNTATSELYLEDALTISVDNYNLKDKSERKSITKALNQFLKEEDIDMQVNFSDNDSYLQDMSDGMPSSWFYAACGSSAEMDTNQFLYGNPHAFADLDAAASLTKTDFRNLSYPDQTGAVAHILHYLGQNPEVPLLPETVLAVRWMCEYESSIPDDQYAVFLCVVSDLGGDPNSALNDYIAYRDNPPEPPEPEPDVNPEPAPESGRIALAPLPERTSITQSAGLSTKVLTDNYMGMKFTVPADAEVGSCTNSELEMCTVTNGEGIMIVLDVTGSINNFADEESMTTYCVENFGPIIYSVLTGGTADGLDYASVQYYDPQDNFFRIKYPVIGTVEDYYLFGSYNHKYEHQWMIVTCQRNGNKDSISYFNDMIHSVQMIAQY